MMKIKTLIKFMPATLVVIFFTSTQLIQAQTTVTPPANSTSSTPGESAYDFYMRLGFAAVQREDHQTAAAYFRSALYENPNDREATIAYWNARNAIKEGSDGNSSQAETDYDNYMRIGYDAVDQEDYQTALINFQRAVDERPGDYYATQAIRNVQTYINRGEGASAPTEIKSAPNIYPGESPYDRYMRLGYAATQREDYQTAALHFRSALYERPNDRQANIAYWNARNAIKDGKISSSTQAESTYERYMRIGYDATERRDYQTALINFRRALDERPGDSYATQAVRNIETFINRGKGL